MKMLDLAKFEKIKEDKNTTTMRHKDGHEMTIMHAKLPKIHREQLKRLKLAGGGDVEESEENPDKIDIPPAVNTIPNPATSPAQNDVVASPQADALANQVPKDLPVDQNLGNPENAAMVPATAMQNAERAGNLQQKIDSAAAEGKLSIAQQQQKNALDIQNRQNQTIIDMKKHTDDFAKYMADHPIKPNAYMKDMGAGQKATTALGLLLGGFTGGFNGTGNNPAYNFLMSQQDKDIAAQKARMDQAHTIYGAYHQLYGDENISTALTKVSMNDKILADSNALAAKLGTPQAQVANLKLRSDLGMKNAELLQKASWIANQPKSGHAAPAAVSAQPSNPEMDKSEKPTFGPESADESGVYNFEPMLKPGASKIADMEARRSQSDPASASQLGRLQEQFSKAGKVDEVLQKAMPLYRSLIENATPGGWTGRNVGPGALAGAIGATGGVGAAIGSAMNGLSSVPMGFITGARRALGQEQGDEFSKERQYVTAHQELSDLLRSVYPSISGGELNSKLSGIAPDQQDKPKDVTAKMKAFEDLVKTSGEFNVIKNKGMTSLK